MLKGAQKRMVVLRTAQHPLYECACFVLRDHTAPAPPADDQLLLHEADRIIRNTLAPPAPVATYSKGRLLLGFVLGLLMGGGIAVVTLLLCFGL